MPFAPNIRRPATLVAVALVATFSAGQASASKWNAHCTTTNPYHRPATTCASQPSSRGPHLLSKQRDATDGKKPQRPHGPCFTPYTHQRVTCL